MLKALLYLICIVLEERAAVIVLYCIVLYCTFKSDPHLQIAWRLLLNFGNRWNTCLVWANEIITHNWTRFISPSFYQVYMCWRESFDLAGALERERGVGVGGRASHAGAADLCRPPISERARACRWLTPGSNETFPLTNCILVGSANEIGVIFRSPGALERWCSCGVQQECHRSLLSEIHIYRLIFLGPW